MATKKSGPTAITHMVSRDYAVWLDVVRNNPNFIAVVNAPNIPVPKCAGRSPSLNPRARQFLEIGNRRIPHRNHWVGVGLEGDQRQ